jgi:ABC-type Fe3+ transport system substrate-binding protein
MITWTLTADEISSVFAANNTLTPGAIIAAGATEDRAAAAAEACEAILTHFAAHADTNRGGAAVTVRVADTEVIIGPGYTVDGRYDATGTTHGLRQVATILTGDSADALLL